MKLHYKTHFIEQEADGFRPYFHALKDLGILTTAQEAVDALDTEQRELDRKRSAIYGGRNG